MMSDSVTHMSAYDPATQPLQPERSLGELFGDMTQELGTLFRKEVQLATAEAREDVRRAGSAAGMLGGAGLAGWMTALFLSLGLAWLLDQAMNTALAFALVGVVWAVVGAVLYSSGRRRLKTVEGLPNTTETLKEDVQWAKAQKS